MEDSRAAHLVLALVCDVVLEPTVVDRIIAPFGRASTLPGLARLQEFQFHEATWDGCCTSERTRLISAFIALIVAVLPVSSSSSSSMSYAVSCGLAAHAFPIFTLHTFNLL